MRFVVLHHTGWPGHADHYDLLLQLEQGRSDDDAVLKAFATHADEFPLALAGVEISLHRLPDHRRVYLSYEGPVSGDRGRVTRVDEGELTLIRSPGATLRDIYVLLAGTKIAGTFRLSFLGEQVYSFAEITACLRKKDGGGDGESRIVPCPAN